MCKQLENRVAIVTGSGQGIGRGIALKLADEGARVVVNSRTVENVNETVKLIADDGNTAIGVPGDVTQAAAVEHLVAETVKAFGTVDILVNNAGTNRDAMFENMTEEQWDEVLDTNLKSAWLCCKYAAPVMREHGYGRIVNIGSEGPAYGNMGMVNYVAAKAGMIGLTMTIAREVGRWARKEEKDFTCNLIMPGFNISRMTEGVPEHLRQRQLDQIVLGRVADSREDVGGAVAFLASPAASYITGAKIGANGGLHMTMLS